MTRQWFWLIPAFLMWGSVAVYLVISQMPLAQGNAHLRFLDYLNAALQSGTAILFMLLALRKTRP